MSKEKSEALNIALEKLFRSKKISGDNFFLDADRDQFIFTSGFNAGCKWMSKKLLNNFKKGKSSAITQSIVDLPKLPPDKGLVYCKE